MSEGVPALPDLLTAMDVGLWLSLPTTRVERMARLGQIPSIRLPGGDLLFDRAELLTWLEPLRDKRPGARHDRDDAAD